LIAFQAVNDTPINADAAAKVLGIPAAASSSVASSSVASPSVASPDEFSQFLTDVSFTVGKAVEAWRARVTEAVLRWEGEGYRTGRLEKLLDQERPSAVDGEIAAYVLDVERLKALEAEVATLDPQASGDKVFHDPGRMAEAEAAAARVREGAAPPPAPSTATAWTGGARATAAAPRCCSTTSTCSPAKSGRRRSSSISSTSFSTPSGNWCSRRPRTRTRWKGWKNGSCPGSREGSSRR